MLKDLIDDYLVKTKQQTIFESINEDFKYSVWPTEASIQFPTERPHGTCLRKIWYRLNGFNQIPLDATIIRKFTLGHLMEDQEIEWARESGILDSNGVKIKMPNPLVKNQIISGKYDFIINLKDKKVIIEYKTSSGWYFKNKVIKEGHIKLEHLLQIGLYLYFLGDYLSHGYLSYADRGNWERRDFRIDLYEERLFVDGIDSNIKINMIFDRWKLLDDYIKKEEIPPRDFIPLFTPDDDEEVRKLVESGIINKNTYKKWLVGAVTLSDFHCNWCPYKHHCLVNNKEEKNVEINKDTIWDIVNNIISSRSN